MHNLSRVTAAIFAMGAVVIAAAALASGTTVTVNMANGQFQPAQPRIEAGDTVVFWNNDSQAHDVIFKDGNGTGAAGSLHPGQNWSYTFNNNGTYEFRCQLHSPDFVHGMVGAVLVGNVSAPPPPQAPGFEFAAAIAAIGAAVIVSVATRRR